MCGKKSSIISSKGHCWLVYGGSGVHWQLIVSAVLACRPRLGRVTLVTRSWTGVGIRESTQYVMFEKDNENIVLSSEEKCRFPQCSWGT